ncbi:hypothetical protein ACWDMY_11250, partial [Streptomyces globisporus]
MAAEELTLSGARLPETEPVVGVGDGPLRRERFIVGSGPRPTLVQACTQLRQFGPEAAQPARQF